MVSKQTGLSRRRNKRKPLDQVALRDLALAYVARFATSAAKLEDYLTRKIRERGVAEEGGELDPKAIVERLVELGYIDDLSYARSKREALLRKGYGARRVEQSLRAAGIAENVREDATPSEFEARRAAHALARKRRFGPFGDFAGDPAKREKQIAAMVRAGHGFDAARALIDARSVEEAEEWVDEAFDEE